ncbi:MAG: D-alanine--D-alanine ligase family protein [Bacteroidia bacterium]|nr:D-alanine--D-alanine ligase family protein [Bacteroidia bacterium]
MSKYNTIAVFYGSDSSEWEVACRSGEFTASRIDETLYDVYQIFARFGKWELVAFRKKNSMRVVFPEGSRPEVDKTDCSVNVLGEKVKFDFVYIMQHGTPGENGLLQGYFEMLGIPFSSCSSFVSAMAFDKYACKSYLRDVDFVKCAPDAFLRMGADVDAFSKKVAATLQFPVFVKPTNAGSSFGISKVKTPEELPYAINYAYKEGPMVLVEQGINGRELTCAAYFDGTSVKALPPIEIVTDNDYFDYDAKYNGNSKELCPAPINAEELAVLQDTTCKIYVQLGCKGLVRIDYILAEDGLYFLEVNTIPGMTSASLVPKMVRAAGMDMTGFLTTIIENS